MKELSGEDQSPGLAAAAQELWLSRIGSEEPMKVLLVFGKVSCTLVECKRMKAVSIK